MTGQRFLTQLAISTVVAIASPAVAAGLLTGASVVASTNNSPGSAIYSTDSAAGAAAANSEAPPFVATHAPAKLSVLVGNDDAAWASAHSVHVVRKVR